MTRTPLNVKQLMTLQRNKTCDKCVSKIQTRHKGLHSRRLLSRYCLVTYIFRKLSLNNFIHQTSG